MAIFGSCVFLIPSNHSHVEDIDDIEENYEASDEDDQNKTSNMENSSSIDDLNKPDPKNMSIFDKSILKQSLVSLSLLFLMQLAGIGSIMQNLAPLMSEVGLNIDAGYQATIAICAQLIYSVMSGFLLNKFGCKILWMTSSGGSALALLLYALNEKFNWSKWLPMIILFVFQFVFGIGMGTVPWIYPSYVFPPEIKPKAISLGTSLTWTGATIVMFLFPYLQKWFGQFGLMLILSVINMLCFFVGLFFLKDFGKK